MKHSIPPPKSTFYVKRLQCCRLVWSVQCSVNSVDLIDTFWHILVFLLSNCIRLTHFKSNDQEYTRKKLKET